MKFFRRYFDCSSDSTEHRYLIESVIYDCCFYSRQLNRERFEKPKLIRLKYLVSVTAPAAALLMISTWYKLNCIIAELHSAPVKLSRMVLTVIANAIEFDFEDVDRLSSAVIRSTQLHESVCYSHEVQKNLLFLISTSHRLVSLSFY